MNNKIKILQVCAVDETIKSLLLPLIDKLIAEGFDVTTCCSMGKNSEELSSKGYKIKNIEIARSINIRSNIKSLIQLIRFIKEDRFDIVHVHTPVAALLGRIAAKLAKVPIVIYTAHGFYFHDRMSWLKYKAFFLIEKFAGVFFTDYIFTQSEEDRITAIKGKIIKSEKICTIGNGVDTNGKFNPSKIDIEEIRRKKGVLGIPDNDKVIMFIGRMVKEKGIIELIEAFNSIEDEGNYKLIIVGDKFTAERDITTFSNIERVVKDNRNVIMTGRRQDINDLLYLCNVFVLPSYREGMPRSIIEAMAMAKPVVATNIRGCREEVVQGETGFLVEVGNPKELGDRILEILKDKRLEQSMGQNGRIRAVNYFNEEKVLELELSIIKKLIKEKNVV